MVITFVVDNCMDPKNGTSMTAYRFIEGLRARVHEVRTLTIGDAAPDNYFVEEAQYGFISEIGHWHGFRFAKFDEKTVRRALEGRPVGSNLHLCPIGKFAVRKPAGCQPV